MNLFTSVRLKSGGPIMTVVDILSDENVVCEWFSEEDGMCRKIFAAATLELVDEGKEAV